MKSAIQQRAAGLGFEACRITTAAPPATADRLQAWLAAGRHGDMAYLARTADRRADPQFVLPGARSLILLAVSYAPEATGTNAAEPREEAASSRHGLVARYARFADYHEVLRPRLDALGATIRELGGPGTRSLACVDTGPVLERDLAQRGGLGFIGKHTNLISRQLGNWFFIAEILTTLELPPDPPERNHCGSCTRCLAACPTRAITAPFELDARRCLAYLTIELKGAIPVEWRPAIGTRIFGCDDCLAVCPWNRFAHAGALMQPHRRPDLSQPDLLELLALDDAGFKARFGGTPLMRIKRRGLLRNVCVALGNAGDAAALPALANTARSTDPLVAEHASWAITQITTRLETNA
ncbi:MAG: tRNA epoxyqueuosine(34) reductase QueG [Verrucomicrobiota bacterium]|jgi:epoxyqueuosine reductase